MQSQVRFNRVPEKVPEKVLGRLWCRARSRSTGFWRRFRRRSGRLWCRARSSSGEGLGGFGVEPGQVQEKVWEALVQGQVRVNRFWEKVPGGFGAEPGQV